MAFTDGKPMWRVGLIAVTAMMFTLAAFGFAFKWWFFGVVFGLMGVFFLFSRLPLLRLAVTREPDAILCRYVPWYEPGPYLAVGWILTTAAIPLAAAFQSDSGPVAGIIGAVLLLMLPLALAQYWRAYRRCRLRITPAALTLPEPTRGYAELSIPRERVLSMTPGTQTVGRGSTVLALTEITFQDTGGARTVQVGPAVAADTVWLTVEPSSLLAALQDWASADVGDPGLLDRLEAAVRRRSRRFSWVPVAVLVVVAALSAALSALAADVP